MTDATPPEPTRRARFAVAGAGWRRPRSATPRHFWTDRRISVAVVFIVAIVGAAAINTSVIVNRSNHNSPLIARTATIAESTSKTLDIIEDSVNPGGERFARGQQAQALAISSINEITVYAAYCAPPRTEGLDALKACVLREYNHAHPTTPTPTTTPAIPPAVAMP